MPAVWKPKAYCSNWKEHFKNLNAAENHEKQKEATPKHWRNLFQMTYAILPLLCDPGADLCGLGRKTQSGLPAQVGILIMEIVSARDFRANHKVLKKAKRGESVLLSSRIGMFKITPVTGMITDGKLPRRTIQDMLDEL